MDARTAKRVPLTEFLEALGHKPASVRGRDYWYASPFRKESTPSFKVDSGRNLWYDHGEGRGGTIVDFVQALYRDPDVSRALRVIATVSGGTVPPGQRFEPAPVPDPAGFPRARVDSVSALADPRLVSYLEDVRGVPLAVAAAHVREIRYRNGEGKGFSAIGFPNRSGGFELRSPSFKGTLGTKDISVVGNPASGAVRLFEGFTDFLSAETLWPEERGKPAVVLNSVALAPRAAELLRQCGATGRAFFDADEAGSRALAAMSGAPGVVVEDMRYRFGGAKDVNDLLLALRESRDPVRVSTP